MYVRRVVKRRTATLTDEEWLQVSSRGKLPRPDFVDRDGREAPAVDVYDLVMERELNSLLWRLESLRLSLQEPMVNGTPGASSTSSVKVGQLLSPFARIWEFLTLTTYASGKSRKPGRLSLSLGSDGLKVTLTDDTSGTYCLRVGETLDDALLALEVALEDGTLKWQKSDFAKGRK